MFGAPQLGGYETMTRPSTSICLLSAIVLICLGLHAGPASAQTFPSQPIKIVVATPPGGIADLVGRTFAQ
jgi:tripartite-type tricarboxylate transporter receptor subunit TctC